MHIFTCKLFLLRRSLESIKASVDYALNLYKYKAESLNYSMRRLWATITDRQSWHIDDSFVMCSRSFCLCHPNIAWTKSGYARIFLYLNIKSQLDKINIWWVTLAFSNNGVFLFLLQRKGLYVCVCNLEKCEAVHITP